MALTKAQLAELRQKPLKRGRTNRLQEAIDLMGTSQAAVGRALGWPATRVNDIVRGRYDDTTVTTARKFADHFGCSIEDLFPSKVAAA